MSNDVPQSDQPLLAGFPKMPTLEPIRNGDQNQCVRCHNWYTPEALLKNIKGMCEDCEQYVRDHPEETVAALDALG